MKKFSHKEDLKKNLVIFELPKTKKIMCEAIVNGPIMPIFFDCKS